MSALEMLHQDRVVGKLTCFDRLIFKGHLANFNAPGRMKAFLDSQRVLLKGFDRYVAKATEQVKARAKALAADAGVPYLYLAETPGVGVSPKRSWPGRLPRATPWSPG